MDDQLMESYLYVMTALVAQQPRHDHVLVQNPRLLVWCCRAEGCGFIKPAEEFDDVRVIP